MKSAILLISIFLSLGMLIRGQEEPTKLIVHAIPFTEIEYGGTKHTFEETYAEIN